MNIVMEGTSGSRWAETGMKKFHPGFEKSSKTLRRKNPLFSSRVSYRNRGTISMMGKEQGSKDPTKRGWFYDTFVKENSMDAKLSKFKSNVAARNGYVGSWFQDSFKYTAWVEVHRKLTERNLQSIECKEAYNLAKSGKAILLDARESEDFEKVHVENAKNAPLFRLIQGNDMKANMRRLGYALLTDFAGTERNPLFIDQAIEAVGGDKRKKVIVMCTIGGTLQTYVERKGPKAKKFKDPERMFGRQSRSLKAVYELQEAGFKNVIHLKDGVNQWIHLGLPLAGTNV